MNNLRILRKAKGMTLNQLAVIFQVKDNTISQWETGKRQPDIDTLIKIAKYFDVSVDYLIGNVNNEDHLSSITANESYIINKDKILPIIEKMTKLDTNNFPVLDAFIETLISSNKVKLKK